MAVTTSHLLDLKTLKNPDGMGQKQVARVSMSKSSEVSPGNREAGIWLMQDHNGYIAALLGQGERLKLTLFAVHMCPQAVCSFLNRKNLVSHK